MSEVIKMHLQDGVNVGGGGGGSDAIWLPSVSEEGVISWSKSTTTTAPTARNIKGSDGRGIASIAKTATSENVDTYTITYTDSTTQTYTVTNGQDGEDGLGIKSVDINASNHLIITYDDDTTKDAGYVGGGSGSASWGGITGTLANQTDLQDALDDKFDADETTIIEPTNLFDITQGLTNYKPNTTSGSKYSEGSTMSGIYTTNLMPCSPSEKFKYNLTSFPSYVREFYYDANQTYIASSASSQLDDDGFAKFQAGTWSNVAYVCLVANFSSTQWNNLIVDEYYHYTPVKKVIVNDLYLSDDNVDMAKERLGIVGNVDNILVGKKWAVIGDSFTDGDFTGVTPPTIPSGRYAGERATYPYLIATRCGMEIQKLFQSGRTLALASDGTNTNSVINSYQDVAADADYLTIYIGINDSHKRAAETGNIPIGTITDTVTSTFYGAWNTILTWFIANRPNLHIGIIVSNGCEIDDYRTATIAIAQKYGIPYIDMNGDKQTPCMIRSTNAAIDSGVRSQRTANWRVSDTNAHPNAACHVFEATFIEDFLRSL
jgi:lysophospholipase L1-like esterase